MCDGENVAWHIQTVTEEYCTTRAPPRTRAYIEHYRRHRRGCAVAYRKLIEFRVTYAFQRSS